MLDTTKVNIHVNPALALTIRCSATVPSAVFETEFDEYTKDPSDQPEALPVKFPFITFSAPSPFASSSVFNGEFQKKSRLSSVGVPPDQ